jgi:hypothetical protein
VSQLLTIRLGLAVAGVIVWLLGLRLDDTVLQYGGIALLVVAVLLRFARPRAGR